MTDPIELPPGVGRLTDLGNAHRMAAANRSSLRYAAGVGWLAWPGEDGPAWARDEAVAVRAGEDTVRAFLEECEQAHSAASENVKAIKKAGLAPDSAQGVAAKTHRECAQTALTFAKKSQKIGQIKAMLDWASTFEEIRIEPSKLDASPHLLASPGRTIDLRDGKTKDPKPEDLISRATNVLYAPKDPKVIADADEWAAYVLDLVRDKETADWLHVWAGYCITGSAKEEKFCILQGPPGDGKGTFVESLAAALGPDLSAALNPDMFVERKGGGSKPWSLARLRGVRLARFSEADGTAKLSAGLICRVTGGESVEAEAKFQAPFDYKPEWKLTFSANDLPHANPDAKRNGLWRRLCLVPCRRPAASEDEQDSRIKARWTDPARGARGVLLWAVQGAMKYYELGRLPPRSPVMISAAGQYQRSSDIVLQFMDDTYTRTEPDPERKSPHSVDRDELYSAFSRWCGQHGIRYPPRALEVKTRLADPPWSLECLTDPRSGSGKSYRGIRLIERVDRNDPAENFDRSGAD